MEPLIPGDEKFVEAACGLIGPTGKPDNLLDILCKLILEDNHRMHEDIASWLQYLADPRSVECLYNAAQKKLSYYDVPENPFARKCL